MIPQKKNNMRLRVHDTSKRCYAKSKGQVHDKTVKESLKNNNIDLAKALQDSKFECKKLNEEISKLRLENMLLQKELIHSKLSDGDTSRLQFGNTLQSNLDSLKFYLQNILQSILEAGENVNSALEKYNEILNFSKNLSSVFSDLDTSSPEYTSIRSTPRLRAVRPMVCGFTVEKPNISLIRIDSKQGVRQLRGEPLDLSNGSDELLVALESTEPPEPVLCDELFENQPIERTDINVPQQPVLSDPLEGTSTMFMNICPTQTIPTSRCSRTRESINVLGDIEGDIQIDTVSQGHSEIACEDMELTAPAVSCDKFRAMFMYEVPKMEPFLANGSREVQVSPTLLSIQESNSSSEKTSFLNGNNALSITPSDCGTALDCLSSNSSEKDASFHMNRRKSCADNFGKLHFKKSKRTTTKRLSNSASDYDPSETYQFSSPSPQYPMVKLNRLELASDVACKFSMPTQSEQIDKQASLNNVKGYEYELAKDSLQCALNIPKLNSLEIDSGKTEENVSRRSARRNVTPGAFAEPKLNRKMRNESSLGHKKKRVKKESKLTSNDKS